MVEAGTSAPMWFYALMVVAIPFGTGLAAAGFLLVTRWSRPTPPEELARKLHRLVADVDELKSGRASLVAAFDELTSAVEQGVMTADRHRRRAEQAERRMAQGDAVELQDEEPTDRASRLARAQKRSHLHRLGA